ncbi:hypothetical protein B0H11DRAFT_1912924 [Mycena galericulata]|nr:hypothetical protein B0H11DRAFT_1912924 [Mycena galericulata]
MTGVRWTCRDVDARAREVQTSSSFCIYTVPVPHRRMFVRSSCGQCTDGHWTSLDAFNQHINNGNEESDPQYPAPRVDPDVTAFFVKSIPSGFRQELDLGEVSTNVEVEEYNVSGAEGVELSMSAACPYN